MNKSFVLEQQGMCIRLALCMIMELAGSCDDYQK